MVANMLRIKATVYPVPQGWLRHGTYRLGSGGHWPPEALHKGPYVGQVNDQQLTSGRATLLHHRGRPVQRVRRRAALRLEVQ